ncbi:DUF4326 domain-containing protein [Massilia sp. YIM B02769]|uniref:DUF4326 domain-containing protein n=1 Tax=Massilia sp. YIM B02769 TaxID=3050129 RepID=UPI0025B6A2F7|nr:DUF4326 domain-containing protein [Massilia sp. YIM B02769]MDN4059557.1 DUF4326 domain-containing protein [Massilia sp. YIM B02769]
MPTVLILYPVEFASQSKFNRKIEKILSRIKNFSVVFPHDNKSLIQEFFLSRSDATLIQAADWSSFSITHAIVFDDGEVFRKEVELLKDGGIPIREIQIRITRVVNIKKETHFASQRSTLSYEYIGRGSYWGNPYSMFTGGESRDEVIRKFKYDFEFDKFPNKKKTEVYKLAGKRLGCFCKPDACHGDVLAEFLNSWDDGQ